MVKELYTDTFNHNDIMPQILTVVVGLTGCRWSGIIVRIKIT